MAIRGHHTSLLNHFTLPHLNHFWFTKFLLERDQEIVIMPRDILPIDVDRRGKRGRSTNIFPTELLHHDGSRGNGELPTKAGAQVHKVRGSGLCTGRTVNILTAIYNTSNI